MLELVALIQALGLTHDDVGVSSFNTSSRSDSHDDVGVSSFNTSSRSDSRDVGVSS